MRIHILHLVMANYNKHFFHLYAPQTVKQWHTCVAHFDTLVHIRMAKCTLQNSIMCTFLLLIFSSSAMFFLFFPVPLHSSELFCNVFFTRSGYSPSSHYHICYFFFFWGAPLSNPFAFDVQRENWSIRSLPMRHSPDRKPHPPARM